jgi:hypothetical protein
MPGRFNLNLITIKPKLIGLKVKRSKDVKVL